MREIVRDKVVCAYVCVCVKELCLKVLCVCVKELCEELRERVVCVLCVRVCERVACDKVVCETCV